MASSGFDTGYGDEDRAQMQGGEGFQTSPGSIDSSRGLSEGFQAGPGSLDSSRGLSEGLSGGSGEYDSRSYANKLNVGTESRTGGGVTLDAGAGENDMGVRGGPGALGGQAQGGLGSSSGTGGSNSGGGSFGEQMKGLGKEIKGTFSGNKAEKEEGREQREQNF